jgi:uncharacterized protein
MQLKGNETVNAAPSRVWVLLMDPSSLAKLVPGISKLEKISENTFKSLLNIKIGPVSTSFAGKLWLEDIITEKSFTLRAQQDSKIGNANTAVKIELVAAGDKQTEVIFNGDVKLSGMLASMGQRIVGGVANTVTKQFFNNLEKELTIKENQNHPIG